MSHSSETTQTYQHHDQASDHRAKLAEESKVIAALAFAGLGEVFAGQRVEHIAGGNHFTAEECGNEVSQGRNLPGSQILKLTPTAIIHRIETARDKVHVNGKIKAVNLEHQATLVDPALTKRLQARVDTEPTGRKIGHRKVVG